ncbi:MAG: 30S ribosomal protein S17 [Gemmatimonadetes bacterium]|jgi:small subunit ribosomal protein S17|nr:30S ribosomal protein S17 [Gemmatimonadota bacterium]MBT7351789.1 30S ribosomal protein S17 [Phycisphaerae bacterium]MBT4609590.1 30S ribosomal protein S17 [Gemmatimonadota bacterium]MBT5055654.1 30S ribosomal protein S17 [Gemmatimonadota bacterium]MBT5143817.1 30S ribosomal protein S17 [Gemmatimonadota bacterium]
MAENSGFGGRVIEGKVVKAGSEKTRVVAIESRTAHRLYGRQIKQTTKAVTHDETNQSNVGDIVRIRECRPLSKTKRWRLIEVVARAAD